MSQRLHYFYYFFPIKIVKWLVNYIKHRTIILWLPIRGQIYVILVLTQQYKCKVRGQKVRVPSHVCCFKFRCDRVWLHLQLVHHLIKQFSGFRTVGVFKVVLDTDLNHDGLQVTTNTCRSGGKTSENSLQIKFKKCKSVLTVESTHC